MAIIIPRSMETRADIEMICPACLDGRPRFWDHKKGFALWCCRACGLVFTVEQGDAGTVQELYDHYYDSARFEMPAVVEQSLNKLAISLEGFRRTGRWLDIGYGEGGLLSVAERHGWKCHGTEISPAALAHGDRQGWVVASDATSDTRFPVQGFDVITMVEILEHVAAPDAIFGMAARLLRPGGVLYLTTPNAGSLNRRLLGARWSIFSPPEHLIVWTANGLRRALARNGLRPRLIRTEGLNPSEILASLRPRAPRASASRNESGLRLNEAFSKSPWRRAIKGGVNDCLSLFRLGDSLKAWAIRPEPAALPQRMQPTMA